MAYSNPYKTDIDFSELANQDVDFAKVLKSNGQLDFTHPPSVQQLTLSLLRRDFGLTLTLPPDRLCPPVPNRLNYIIWIQGLLDTSSTSYLDAYESGREVLGLDIGTGASAIYPLLGCRQRDRWCFVGTDIDEKSLEFARANVEANGFGKRIKILQTGQKESLIPFDKVAAESIDFTMCNPPFYESTADMLTSAAAKQRRPFTACTGSESEMVTPGGEVAFVTRMITESLLLRTRVQWYTSMLGKHSSLELLIAQLHKHEISNYAVTEFVQGSKTRRWAIAWSFRDLRPTLTVSRGLGGISKALLPVKNEFVVELGRDIRGVGEEIDKILGVLPLKWLWKESASTGIGFCEKAVWARSFRRKGVSGLDDMGEEEENMAFGFKIKLQKHPQDQPGTMVIVRWLKGLDSVIFESFCGMLKRKLIS